MTYLNILDVICKEKIFNNKNKLFKNFLKKIQKCHKINIDAFCILFFLIIF